MRLHLARGVLAVLASAVLVSCSDTPSAPPLMPAAQPPLASVASSVPQLVISQIYGGGGNSGATLRNDFIEIFNPGTTAVSLTGWSVQYASSTGTTWTVTSLGGSVAPGGYYLIQQAAGTGGTANLPTPDATGTAAMSATGGKVLLANTTTAFAGTACPAGTGVVDFVQYGTTTSTGSCSNQTGTALTNTTAAFRLDDGCTYTGSNSADFTTGAPNPRNSASPTKSCQGPGEPASVVVLPATATKDIGETQAFSATAYDANGQPTPTSFTWSSDNTAVATIDGASGVATAVAEGNANITATASNNVSGSAVFTVQAPPPPPPLPEVRFSEIHYDNVGTDANEAIEVEGPAGTNLTGWSVVLYNGNGGVVYDTDVFSGVIPDLCNGRGVLYIAYPSNGIQNGSPDGFALVDASGNVIEFLSYEGTFTAADGPAAGLPSKDIGAFQDGTGAVGNSLKRNPDDTWVSHAANFGACGDDPVPPPPNSITFSGRTPGDAPLPVGFEDQLFATLRDGATGNTIATTFTWSSDTPALASIDARGVFRALGEGTAVLRATADVDGTTATIALPTIVATANPAASYVGNTEFGDPVDGDPGDDFIIRRPQYTTSWNQARGIPNWVSYNLEGPHMVSGQDRCDCFTFDPELETAGFSRYNTADYTGAGAFAGYGIDRGHLVRSFDRTIGTLDNAHTYYFSNIIPQAADNNQGPWSQAEIHLGDLARFQNKELYIIAGASGSKGTVKDEGRITIPSHVWKVAVIMPRDQGLAHIDDYQDLQVIAVIMPNDPGIRSVAWQTYETTVDAVEALSGYDLLSLLPDKIEIAIESRTHPPTAATDGPYASIVGEPVAMSGAASSDADNDPLAYAWNFGDGSSGSGVSVTHTYQQAGTFTVRLIVTDTRGIADTASTSATVITAAQAVQNAVALVQQLVAEGRLAASHGNALVAKLSNAQKQLERGSPANAVEPLQSVLDQLAALVRTGQLASGDAAPLQTLVQRILATIR